MNNALRAPHWVNIADSYPEHHREVFLLMVGPDRNGSREIEYAKGKWLPAGWILTVPSQYDYVVAWLEDAGRILSLDEVSKVPKDALKF